MKAFLISEDAHPSKIQLTHDAPEPVPTPGSDDLLISVHSARAALNFFDVRSLLRPRAVPLSRSRRLTVRRMPYNGRYCNLRESTRHSPRVRSCSAPSLPGPSRRHLQGARTSAVTAYSGVHRAHTASALSRSQSTCCLYPIRFRSTREPVSRYGRAMWAICGRSIEEICAGLFITYPTSYEALVGRAKLQAGTHAHI